MAGSPKSTSPASCPSRDCLADVWYGLKRGGVGRYRELQRSRARKQTRLQHVEIRRSRLIGPAGVPHEDGSRLITLYLLAQAMDRIPRPRRVHNHDQDIGSVNAHILGRPPHDISDRSADLADQSLRIYGLHTGNCTWLHTNEQIPVPLSMPGSRFRVPIGEADNGLDDVGEAFGRLKVKRRLPLDPPVFLVTDSVSNGKYQGPELART